MKTSKTRTHMNICQECRKPFELKDNVDYCPSCVAILDENARNYELSDEERKLAISLYGYDWWRYI